ncbi:phosphoribosylaminoimidazole-succinocarboxamide synthase [Quercus suber]|uniref:phosphoribosylaminoimidazolesuccinocarboxamide synthase n=1 Tax=Quercus suber TaxID=58331 RepID=A0AAW0KJW4_QUESU
MIIGESSRHSDDQLYSQKRLIKVSLKALGSATYAPGNSTRSQHSRESSLPATLSLIFGNLDKFGGDIYYSAVTVMSEIIHKDPTCFPALDDLGLPAAILSLVVAGILPSSKALTCVPNGLGAICFNSKGLEAVKEASALRKKYVTAMNGAIVPLADAVEELLRHVSSLRSTGVDIIIEIRIALEHGLILVDTKYEFGKANDGSVVLIDEVHTPDSSRYWIANSYDERFRNGLEPENVDKEFLRLWFKDHCNPYEDEVFPDAPADLVCELAWRYVFSVISSGFKCYAFTNK